LKGWRILLVFNGQVANQYRSGYAMSKDGVVEFKTPVQAEDPLTELLRMGSQKLIAGAVEAEFAE
jgi:hypothetical protein